MLKKLITLPMAAWLAMVFLGSLPYKFTNHPDTQHIFGTIGDWIGTFLGDFIGGGFSAYAGYIIGGIELIAALLILIPILFWGIQAAGFKKMLNVNQFIALGGLLASGVMAGAIFFHVFSPLGIEVLHQGESDGGSLFKAAVSVFIIGLILFVIYKDYLQNSIIARLPIIGRFI